MVQLHRNRKNTTTRNRGDRSNPSISRSTAAKQCCCKHFGRLITTRTVLIVVCCCLFLFVSIHEQHKMTKLITVLTSTNTDNGAAAGGGTMAEQQSYGLITGLSDEEWYQIQRTVVHDQPLLGALGDANGFVVDGTRDNAHQFLTTYIQPNFACPHVVEMGGVPGKKIDGTKFVCNPERVLPPPSTSTIITASATATATTKPSCLIYSFGCAGMYAFEDGMAALHQNHCEIHVFDPAPATSPRGDRAVNLERNIHYHPWGLLSSYDASQSSNVWPAGTSS